MLPAKTVDTWESSAGIGKQEESGRVEVGEKSGEEHRICPECLSGGIHKLDVVALSRSTPRDDLTRVASKIG